MNKEKKEKNGKGGYAFPLILGGTAGRSLVAVPAVLAGRQILKDDLSEGMKDATRSTKAENLYNRVVKKHELTNITWLPTNHPSIGPAYSGPLKKGQKSLIYVDKAHSPEYMAHELGHAIDYKKGLKTKMLLRKGAPLLGYGAAIAATGNDETRPYAGAAVAAGYAPTLWQEGKASYLGYKELKDAGASTEELLKAKKNLGKAFSTYALPVVAGAGLAQYLVNRQVKRNKEEEA